MPLLDQAVLEQAPQLLTEHLDRTQTKRLLTIPRMPEQARVMPQLVPALPAVSALLAREPQPPARRSSAAVPWLEWPVQAKIKPSVYLTRKITTINGSSFTIRPVTAADC